MTQDTADEIALGDRELFNRIANKYAAKDLKVSTSIPRRYQLVYAVQPVIDSLGTKITIVDVGCGVGASAAYLKEHCSRFIGVDHSDEMIRMAKTFEWADDQTEFIAADIKDSSLASCEADMVLAIGALHHMTELDNVMQAFRNCAKPGAWFVAIEPQRGNPVIGFARWVRKKIDSSYSEDQQFFSYAELYDLCSRNNLQDVSLEYQGFLSKPFGQVILPIEPLARLISRVAVAIDSVLDPWLPRPFRYLSWDLIVRARFPDAAETDSPINNA